MRQLLDAFKMFEYYNPNPDGSDNNDCVIRALTKILNKSWEDVYWELAELGFLMHDMPSVNKVWDECLLASGRMTQEQFNQLSNMAQQFQGFMGKR